MLFALESDGEILNADDRDEFWYVQAGIEKNFTGLGNTTIYGEYYKGEAGAGLSSGNVRNLAIFFPDSGFDEIFMTSSTLEVWGFGLVQQIDAAAMDLYIGFRNYSGDANLLGLELSEGGDVVDRARRKVDFDDFQAVFAGAMIRF